MLIVALAGSANLYYVLNAWRKTEDTDLIYEDDIQAGSYINSFIYSYNLSLGDFSNDGYDGEAWILFVAATFIV